jgi:CDP-glucose 4,6-dehydratase
MGLWQRPLEDMVTPLHQFFQGKRVLVTGHTGFKGAWLSLWLHRLGAKVTGVALDSLYADGLYQRLPASVFEHDLRHDIREFEGLTEIILSSAPDLVFHLAAQPLVRDSYDRPLATFITNAVGTAHVLEAIKQAGCTANVFVITSDKCYENNEWPHSYRENDRLGGHDIYSMSKAATELVAAGWRSSFFSRGKLGKLVTLRAGNVIGGGDFSKDRLIPDCARSAEAGTPILIRSPKSTRPWQHVLDCLHGYLVAASKIDSFPTGDPSYEAFNFGPAEGGARPVLEVVQAFFKDWVNPPSIIIDEAIGHYHEAGYLSVSIEKAGRLLGWHPVWPFQRALAETSSWYQAWQSTKSIDLAHLAGQQIAAFEADAAQS